MTLLLIEDEGMVEEMSRIHTDHEVCARRMCSPCTCQLRHKEDEGENGALCSVMYCVFLLQYGGSKHLCIRELKT
jgi:hypothetical protein